MKVDFYILEEAGSQKALFFACQLLEKAYRDAKPVYVHFSSLAEAERFDTLLWTFKEESFLPHLLYSPNQENEASIQIGFGDAPQNGKQEVLLNLCAEFPLFFQQFKHVIEIVFSDPHVQQLARERFKQYRDQGCEINTYKLKANEL